MLRMLLVVGATWLYLLLAALVGVPHVLLTRRLNLIYGEARTGIRLLLWLAGIRVVQHGREYLADLPAPVYMSNHQSNLDPPIVFVGLPGFVSILAKRELFRIPVLGTVMRVGGVIPVDRSHKDAARESVDLAAVALRSGRPFLVFPEGTRSPDGKLLPFKKGAFILAEKGGAPILPITIVGTRALMPKGSLRMRAGHVDVYYHPPVWPQNYSSREELMEAVRSSIASHLPQ